MFNKVFKETKYLCIKGQYIKADEQKEGENVKWFMKVTNPTQVTTTREYVEEYKSLTEMKAAYPLEKLIEKDGSVYPESELE